MSAAGAAAGRALRDRRGAAAVEFALVAAILFTLILVTFDLMGLMQSWSVLQSSASGAAREVMASPTMTAAQAAAKAQARAGSSGYASSTGISFSARMTECGVQKCMVITGSYRYAFVLLAFGGTGVTLTSRAVAPLNPIWDKGP